MILRRPARTWFNVVLKARLIEANTNGEEDILVAKYEAGAVENFGVFLGHIPHLEFLNSSS